MGLLSRMLGHASAAMTLDRYADLFDDDLDEVADRLDALRAASRGRVADLESAGQMSGDEGNRTPNPRLAKAVLCQLSYVPGGCYEPGLRVRWAC